MVGMRGHWPTQFLFIGHALRQSFHVTGSLISFQPIVHVNHFTYIQASIYVYPACEMLSYATSKCVYVYLCMVCAVHVRSMCVCVCVCTIGAICLYRGQAPIEPGPC